MPRILIDRGICLLVLGFLCLTGFGQDGDRPQGPPDPDVWVLSVLEELSSPLPANGKSSSNFRTFRQTGMPPAEEQRGKGSFVDEQGVFHRGLIKRGKRRERVIADAGGPGVLTRIWLARQAGQLRVYADGAAEPVIDMACDAIFGNHLRFFTRPLCTLQGSSAVLSLPIPFKKSLQVTIDGPSCQYEVQFRSYSKDASLETFTAPRCVEAIYRAGRLIGSLNERLAVPAPLAAKPGEALVVPRPGFSAPVPTRKSVLVFEEETSASRVVDSVTLELVTPFTALGELDKLDMLIDCDGERRIEMPLKHFFGIGSDFATGISDAVQAYEAIPRRIYRWRFRLPVRFDAKVKAEVRNRGVGSVEGLRLTFTTREASAAESKWSLCGTSVRSQAGDTSLGLSVAGSGVLARESVSGPFRSLLDSSLVHCRDDDGPVLDASSLRAHFGVPKSGKLREIGSSLWGRWEQPGVRGFALTRCRGLDRVPFTGLSWGLNGLKTTVSADFSASLMYYRPVEKSGALPDGAGR